jgi:hypothetical protein
MAAGRPNACADEIDLPTGAAKIGIVCAFRIDLSGTSEPAAFKAS